MKRKILKNTYGRHERYYVDVGYSKQEFETELEELKKETINENKMIVEFFDFNSFFNQLSRVGFTLCTLVIMGDEDLVIKENVDYLNARIEHFTDYPLYDVDLCSLINVEDTGLSLDLDSCMIQSYIKGTLTKEFISEEEVKEIVYREIGNILNTNKALYNRFNKILLCTRTIKSKEVEPNVVYLDTSNKFIVKRSGKWYEFCTMNSLFREYKLLRNHEVGIISREVGRPKVVYQLIEHIEVK